VAEEGRYRLTPVRELRALAEREKRGELAGAVGDARVAEERLVATREKTTEARRLLQAAHAHCQTATTAARRMLAERYVARARRAVEAAVADELRAEAALANELGEVDLARRTLARARADRELVERHFARWREAQRKLADRRED
jgi:hypothetical protein